MGIAVRIDKVEQDKFKKTQFIHLGDRAVFIYNSCKLFIGQIAVSYTHLTGDVELFVQHQQGVIGIGDTCYQLRTDCLTVIQIGYTLPQRISSKFFVSKLRAFVSMDNILTITSYPGLDPEIGTRCV